MKTITFINPNSTVAMTNSCVETLRSELSEFCQVRGITNYDGPAAIQGEADGIAAIPGLLTEIEKNSDCDGFIIGCFDDTGLAEARLTSKKPIIGIGQSAFHMAALRHGEFCVLTTLEISISVIKQNIKSQGFSNLCKGVMASGIPVLELENNPISAANTLSECIKTIEVRDPKIAVVLGCAGMTNVYRRLQARHDVYLLDPIVSSARMINAIL
jgi:allantoin racemase